MVSFKGKKSLGHAKIGLLWEFNSKFPTVIPAPFICELPPPSQFSVVKRSQFDIYLNLISAVNIPRYAGDIFYYKLTSPCNTVQNWALFKLISFRNPPAFLY